MGVCCVEGCTSIGHAGIVYFEFPTSRTLRRKWLDAIKIGSKVALGTVVCSQHFDPEDYETVRGKVRLKRKVVPTQLLETQSPGIKPSKIPSPRQEEPECYVDTKVEPKLDTIGDNGKDQSKLEPDENQSLQQQPDLKSELAVLPEVGCSPESQEPECFVETVSAPKRDPIGDETEIKLDFDGNESGALSNLDPSSNVMDVGSTLGPAVESGEQPSLVPNRDSESMEICKVVANKNDTVLTIRAERDPQLPDPKQPPDFEDMITNYQIKNKPNVLRLDETDIVCERDDTIVVDDRGDVPPVFIELSVDKEANPTNGNSQDCLMVLESVQVDVDPSSLMLPDREYVEPDHDSDIEITEPVKKEPISLLTSSDEDDVIIQEPNIDTVEVSDEDEDDVPLVKLVKSKPKRMKKAKPGPRTAEDLRNIVWSCGYDFYCMKCQFATSDSVAYSSHLEEHQRILQVCSVCSYATSSKSQYSRHLRKHKEERPYKCHLCDYNAKHNMSLMYHLESHKEVTGVKKGFKCVKCGFRSDYKGAVVKHLKNCVAETRFSCDLCSYETKRKSDLKRHSQKRHGDVVDLDSDDSFKPDWD